MIAQDADVVPVRRWRDECRPVAVVVGGYLLIRLLHVLLLQAGLRTRDGLSLYERLGAWDGGWYVRIATEGYPDHLSLVSQADQSTGSLVFPPLYPMLMRAVAAFGPAPLAAGIIVSAVCGLLAVIGVYAVARDLVRPSAAMATALLWAAGPMTIVLSMAYSEALFVALAAWAVWLVRRDKWLAAGALGLAAGLTRSNGLAVGVAVAVAAAIVLYRHGLRPAPSATSDEPPGHGPRLPGHGSWSLNVGQWRPIVGALLALAGVPLWWLYVAIVGGRIDAWFAAQNFFWGSQFDFGASVASNAWGTLTFQTHADDAARLVHMASFLAMLGAVGLMLALVHRAWRAHGDAVLAWWPVAAYCLVLVALAVGSAGYTASKLRFLIPMFPLLVLPGIALARLPRPWRAVLIGVLALASGWFGAYMLTVWTFAI